MSENITAPQALEELEALADPAAAEQMAAYHRASRRYLGVGVPAIEGCVRRWRAGIGGIEARVALARGLWDSDVHEGRVAAAKLLTQARMGEGEGLVWDEFQRWVRGFDAWAIADHACKVGGRRLVADPARLETVEGWIADPNKWVRRSALVVTLPWTKMRHPSDKDREIRERVLGWVSGYVADRDWFIQKAVSWWLRSLSLREPERVRAFLAGPGQELKAFARKDAGRLLGARG